MAALPQVGSRPPSAAAHAPRRAKPAQAAAAVPRRPRAPPRVRRLRLSKRLSGLVNSSDTSIFALSALFSKFQAQTTGATLRDRKTCVITVVLEPQENMSIGVAHVDFRGSAYVPVSGPLSANPQRQTHARLHASYSITGMSYDRIANTTYAAGYNDQFYESFDVSEVAETPCEKAAKRGSSRARVFEFRIFATISAAKASASDDDVAIAVDTNDAKLQKGMYYELTTRRCAAADSDADAEAEPAPTS